MVFESNPKVAECLQDLGPLRQMRNVSFKALQDEVKEIQSQSSIISKEVAMINVYKEHPLYFAAIDDVFTEKISEFHSESSSKVTFLLQEMKGLSEQVEKVFTFFGESEDSKMTPEIMMGYLTKFLNAFEVHRSLTS